LDWIGWHVHHHWAAAGDVLRPHVECAGGHSRRIVRRRIVPILASVAADYSRNLREEAKKGIYGRLKQGLWPGPAPLGTWVT